MENDRSAATDAAAGASNGGLVDTVLADRYRVAQVVSTGANTVIADAIDLNADHAVTVKIVRPEHAASAEFRRKFERLAEISSALTHPNINSVLDWGEIELKGESTVFWVTDALGGGSMRDLLDRGRTLSPGQALVVGLEACRALDAAHQIGLFHTELTPSKLVFGADRRVRIVDFGMARLLGESAWADPATVPTHVARYASPEQAIGLPIDAKTDVYALSLVLIESVTGSVPFAADSTVATLAGRVDKLMPVSADLGSLAAVLERAGRPEPEDRYTAAEFGRALVQAASKLPKPEPIPILATGLFDTAAMRRPEDPTGGIERPAGAADDADAPDDGGEDDGAGGVAVAAAAGAAVVVGAGAAAAGAETVTAADDAEGAADSDETGAGAAAAGSVTVDDAAEAAGAETVGLDDAEGAADSDETGDAADAAGAAASGDEHPEDGATGTPAAADVTDDETQDGEGSSDDASAGAGLAAVAVGAGVVDAPSGGASPGAGADEDVDAPAVGASPGAGADEDVDAPAGGASPGAGADEDVDAPAGAASDAAVAPAATERDGSGSDGGDGAHELLDVPMLEPSEDELHFVGEPAGEVAPTGPHGTEQMPATAVATSAMATTAGPRLYDEPLDVDPSGEVFLEPRRRRRTGAIVLLVVVLLAGLAGLGYAGYLLLRTKSFEVPVLAGTAEGVALNQIEGNGWVIETERERSDTFPEPDTVIRTEPGPGTDLEEGETLVMVLSDGYEFRTLPDVTGLTVDEAAGRLTELRLEAVEADEREYSEDVPDGTVISWVVRGDAGLEAGAQVLPGETIVLTVSQGPAPREVPALGGLTVDEAIAELASRQLELVQGEDVFSDEVDVGRVVVQTPAPGEQIARGETVTVQISKGPDFVAFPDLDGLSFADAQELLLETGFRIGDLLGTTDGTFVEASIDGEEVAPGTEFRRGQVVDLIFL